MNYRMYWDTETTGLYQSRDFHRHEKHPAIMEYAHVLVDDDWNEVEHFQCFVKVPAYVEVHEKAYAAHGISRDKCEAEGVEPMYMFERFIAAVANSRLVGGYNINYDKDMMEITYHRLQAEYDGGIAPLAFPPMVDLMPYATPICALPPTDRMKAAGRMHFKSPSLTEALRIICRHEHAGAHGALADARGCARLHRKLWEMKNGKE
jgi:DNA polymerase-3 subunit epsilon